MHGGQAAAMADALARLGSPATRVARDESDG